MAFTVGPYPLGYWGTKCEVIKRYCSPVCKPGSVRRPRGDGVATIYLRVPSPKRFTALAVRHPVSLARVEPTRLAASHGVASDRVYSKSMLPWKWVSSYLAFPSLPPKSDGGLFLLPFSGGLPRLTLSAILLCDARTFLTVLPFGMIPRGRPTKLPLHYTTFFPESQGFPKVFESFEDSYHPHFFL